MQRQRATSIHRPALHAMGRFAAVAALVTAAAFAAPRAAWPQPLPAPLARALASASIPESAVAVYVHEAGAAAPVLAAGADRPLNPASTMKLLTAYAALALLGPAYQWNTEVFVTGAVQGGVLDGDLVIKGYGDPRLTLEDFWLLLREVRSRGVREIRGDLVLDRAYFAVPESVPGGFDGDPTRPYNTGPDALLVNFKSVRLTLIPEPATRSMRVTVEPPLPEVTVVNRLRLDNAPCGSWERRIKVDAQGDESAARFVLGGAYSTACGEQTRYYSVLGHPQYAASLFRMLWRELGGTLAGGVRDGEAGPDARLLARVRSPSLAEIVRDINKFSNNVMARQLYLTIGAHAEGAPGTVESADRTVRQWLAAQGIAAPGLVIENGSGLSRDARMSARTLGELLLAAFASPVMPEFMASMPLAAVDGTMKKRLNGAAVAGQAHIKTGLLKGVRAIAGYVLDRRGRRMAVVLLINHPNYGAGDAAQDALLEWVYAREGDGPRRMRRRGGP